MQPDFVASEDLGDREHQAGAVGGGQRQDELLSGFDRFEADLRRDREI